MQGFNTVWFTLEKDPLPPHLSPLYKSRMNTEAESWISLTTCFLPTQRQTVFCFQPGSYRGCYDWGLLSNKTIYSGLIIT